MGMHEGIERSNLQKKSKEELMNIIVDKTKYRGSPQALIGKTKADLVDIIMVDRYGKSYARGGKK